jgi:hypothetical protein
MAILRVTLERHPMTAKGANHALGLLRLNGSNAPIAVVYRTTIGRLKSTLNVIRACACA